MRRIGTLAVCLAIAMLAIAGAVVSPAFATSYGALAWGNGTEGQLGNGANQTSTTPVAVNGLFEVSAVAGGGNFSLALQSNGTVMAWGEGSAGQLGNGATKKSDVPVKVSGLSGVVGIAAGGNHGIALLENGTVETWGLNSAGQLGNGTTTNSDTPAVVSGLSEVVAVAAGGSQSAALLSNGTVKTWGENGFGQLGDGTDSGPETCGAIITSPCSKTPVSVSGLSGVAAISTAGGHDLALLGSGKVEAWGLNSSGQLGVGTSSGPEKCGTFVEQGCSTTPLEVSELSGVSAVAAGGSTSMALLSSGAVRAWGFNAGGQLGNGTTTPSSLPVAVSGLSNATAIAEGQTQSLALRSTGTVAAWGANGDGQLGNGTTTSSSVPVAVTGLAEIAGIAAGGAHSLAFGAPGPAVFGISPSSGPTSGGTTVTLTGAHLSGASAVKFGNLNASSFTVVSSTTITAVAPASTPRTVDVTVTTAQGTSALTLGDRYTYVPTGTIELGRCNKVATGKGAYKSAGCTEPLAGGNFEWSPGFVKAGFTDSGGPVTLETVGKAAVTCKGETGSGEYSGAREVAGVVLRLSECELAGSKCTSTGAGTGEIVTSTLEGALGWREKAGNKVALDLFPAGGTGSLLEATCGTSSLVVRGSVIGPITPVNNMSASFSLKYKQTKGKQTTEHFEGEANDVLEASIAGGAYEQAGLALESTQANEEELEINTVV